MVEKHYPAEGTGPVPNFEDTPLTRGEYIAALVHFYRGELYRSTQWRLRLDNTTNWSILSVMGLVTFSLGDVTHSHAGILVGMALVLTFLGIEARRFRFFDVWRTRTRMLEENFYGPILRRDLASPLANWGRLVAEDLLEPSFKISYHQALRTRLLRNYVPLFTLLVFSWFLKLTMGGAAVHRSFMDAMSIGALPGWVALTVVCAIYGYLIGIAIFVRSDVTSDELAVGGAAREKVRRIDL
jgi:uncharacterized membrane protein